MLPQSPPSSPALPGVAQPYGTQSRGRQLSLVTTSLPWQPLTGQATTHRKDGVELHEGALVPPQRLQGLQQLALNEETLGRQVEKRVQRNSERLRPSPEASPRRAAAMPSCDGRLSGEGGQRLGSVGLQEALE